MPSFLPCNGREKILHSAKGNNTRDKMNRPLVIFQTLNTIATFMGLTDCYDKARTARSRKGDGG
jgi:hypothetical protein